MLQMDDRQLYERKYFDGYYANDKRRDEMYKQEARRIQERANFGNILDIGCGVGGFLSTLDDRWKKYGFEPSEYAAEKATARGITMLRNPASIDTEVFDVVVFRGTLQHMSKPIETLAHATRGLRKGGLLVILATPDTDGIVYKLWGKLPPLDAPRNWVLFGNRFLRNILERMDYENIEVLHPYFGTPYANPVKDFLAFLISLFFGWRKFAFPGNMMEIYAVKK